MKRISILGQGALFCAGVMALFLPNGAAASSTEACKTYHSTQLNKNVRYCIVRSRPDLLPVAGEPVVYYFHGIMGDQKRFFSDGYAATLNRIAKLENFPPMTFVSFETEKLSYHIDRNATDRAYQKWFLGEFTGFIENKYNLCRVRACRGLFGNSMGGIGTFYYGFNFPDQFGVLANNAPVIVPYNIFDSLEKWDDYFQRHPIWRAKGFFLIGHTRFAFKNRETFSAHQVLDYARIPSTQALPELYFDAGGKDEYGFDEGHFLLKEILDRRGVRYQSDFYQDGQHEIMQEPWRAEKILRFLASYFNRQSRH